MYSMRPLTHSWIDEACLTTNSVHPPSYSPTLPCLFSEQTERSSKQKQGTEAPAEMFTLPDVIGIITWFMHFLVGETMVAFTLMISCILPLIGQGYFELQTILTCLVFKWHSLKAEPFLLLDCVSVCVSV